MNRDSTSREPSQEEAAVPAPYIFVTTQTMPQGSVHEFLEHHPALAELLSASQPSRIGLRTRVNREQSEVTFVLVFANAQAAAAHLPAAREKLGLGVEIELNGELDAVLRAASTALAQQVRGLRLAIHPRGTGTPVGRTAHASWRDLFGRRVQEAPR
jgi:hypothetical protein